MKRYTVIGMRADCNDSSNAWDGSFLRFVVARSPAHAAATARWEMALDTLHEDGDDYNRADLKDKADSHEIIAVIEGEHNDLYCPQTEANLIEKAANAA